MRRMTLTTSNGVVCILFVVFCEFRSVVTLFCATAL